MDREEKLSRRAVAAARRLNQHPKLLELARQSRRQPTGSAPTVDPLAAERGHPSDLAARQLEVLRGARPGFVGELGMRALEAWQRLAESQARGRGDVDVAILFTDLVGFSSWALEAGDAASVDLLRQVSEAVEPPVLESGGEVVKRLGDGLMAAFGGGPAAFEAALAARERAAAIAVDGYRPRLRTGIHIGRPRKLGKDYFGVDVNVAARLVEAAKPDEILVSGQLLETLDGASVRAQRRRFKAKGAPAGLSAYALARA